MNSTKLIVAAFMVSACVLIGGLLIKIRFNAVRMNEVVKLPVGTTRDLIETEYLPGVPSETHYLGRSGDHFAVYFLTRERLQFTFDAADRTTAMPLRLPPKTDARFRASSLGILRH